MKQKKMLSLTLSQIRQLYCQELPELTAMAQQSLDDTDFKNHLQEFLTPYISGGPAFGSVFNSLWRGEWGFRLFQPFKEIV